MPHDPRRLKRIDDALQEANRIVAEHGTPLPEHVKPRMVELLNIVEREVEVSLRPIRSGASSDASA